MDEKEFKELDRVYKIRLQKLEKELNAKKKVLKSKQQATQACAQQLAEEERIYQDLDSQMNAIYGKPIKPKEIDLWRSRQSKQKYAISEAATKLKEAQNNEAKARDEVSKQAKIYAQKTVRHDNFYETISKLVQQEKEKREQKEEEKELDL